MWDKIKYNIGALGIALLLFVPFLLWVFAPPTSPADNDWYLVCSGKDKDYLVKSEGKPYTKDGFIYVDGDSFITAEAGMTCKPVTGEVVRAAIGQKGLEQGK